MLATWGEADGSYLAGLHQIHQLRSADTEETSGFADADEEGYLAQLNVLGVRFGHGLMR
jgi:hypothetical protein